MEEICENLEQHPNDIDKLKEVLRVIASIRNMDMNMEFRIKRI